MDDVQFADCGPWAPYVRQIVEDVVPEDVLEEFGDRLFFMVSGSRDGVRLGTYVRTHYEVVILSEHILPGRTQLEEDNPVMRYFMYAILHEVAHAVRGHRSIAFDGISRQQNEAQEREADGLAMEWFNKRAVELNTPPMTEAELAVHQERNQTAMQRLWWR